ncbi:MAG: hypothetical protein AB1896_04420, partial [Thermodesulfobacteriota bacterium]
YDRGLSVDILGLGTINDFRRAFPINKPTFIVAQKDHLKFGRIPVVLRARNISGSAPPAQVLEAARTGEVPAPTGAETAEAAAPAPESAPVPAAVETAEAAAPPPPETPAPADAEKPFRVLSFLIEVDGREHEVPAGGRLEVVEGDKLKVLDIVTEGQAPAGMDVNFKGFVADQANNTGEDRGRVIDTAKALMPRYSLSKTEKIYEVVVEQGRKTLASMTVRLNAPRLDYLVLRCNGGEPRKLPNGQAARVKPGDRIQVVELKTNVPDNHGIELVVKGRVKEDAQSQDLLSFHFPDAQSVTLIVTRQGRTIGQVVLHAG